MTNFFVKFSKCSFVTKSLNCENYGVAGILIMDSDRDNEMLVDMIDDDTNRKVKIPAAFLTWRDG